jgi:phage repressor protein C with HTH and peptisase S24 domain
MTRLGFAIVRGRSMEPGLREGDRLLVRYDARVRPGRVVLARFPDGTLAVKRALERRTTAGGSPAWWLVSDNPGAGTDSRHRGPIPDTSVLAVVVLRVWPLSRRRS